MLLLLLPGCIAAAEDFKLSDGTVFRQVRVLEVRPDALVLAHDRGTAMADLEKLPRGIRARYGYDPSKAAAYRKREAVARQAAAEEDRRLIAAHEERKQALARAQWEAADAATAPFTGVGETHLFFRVGDTDRAYAAAVTRVGAEIAQAEEARLAAARAPETFWTAPFWRHPIVIILGGLLGGGGRGEGSNSEPRNWR